MLFEYGKTKTGFLMSWLEKARTKGSVDTQDTPSYLLIHKIHPRIATE